MSKKCDINIPDDINGNSPLFLATTLKQVCWPALAEVTYFRVKLTFLYLPDWHNEGSHCCEGWRQLGQNFHSCSSLNVMIPSWQYWHISRTDFYWFSIQADWEGKTPAHFAAYNGFAEELHLLCTRFLSISPLILSGPAYLGISKDQGWGVFFRKGGTFENFCSSRGVWPSL